MQLALQELRDYLRRAPERPEFRNEATRALATVETWIARRHIIIADFYRTVGNDVGERLHLDFAVRDFPSTPAGQEAAERLTALGPKPAPEAAPSAEPGS